MKDVKPKQRVIRKRKAGNSPSPSASKCGPCGHSHCGENCNVRHIGPTSHMRDHHILHTARGVAHIWTAVIIAGFALVLTGAIAYSTAQAKEQKSDQLLIENSTNQILNKIENLESRIDAMERDMEGLFRAQASNKEMITPEGIFPSP
ncbi:MAG: hypothetical protein ACOYUZ_05300 [Patescibacteria group bacterium]